ncbi:MAG TPA: UbiA prenyltransferase family protein [Ignavibacteria bacterium]|nr:UbiA prenyltransferase family protein [Ignavibacteria bacterium]
MIKKLTPYISIARPDHWFKNVFMLPGIFLAYLFSDTTFHLSSLPHIILGIFATCLIASANYTINEWLDAPFDREHPVKKFRPAAIGQITAPLAYLQYAILAVVGLAISNYINVPFCLTNAFLLFMGLLYNVPPIRTKDVPYLDVVSESVNNSIRLMLGWYLVIDNMLPPLSIIIAYWMLGAFFMAMKRLGEIRFIQDNKIVKTYRKSLAYYTQEKLITSIIFYSSLFSFTSAIFLIRYKFELILVIPLLSLLIAEYMRIGFLPDSPVQYPEKLYKQKGLVLICFLCLALFTVLLFVKIPWLTSMFDPLYKQPGL